MMSANLSEDYEGIVIAVYMATLPPLYQVPARKSFISPVIRAELTPIKSKSDDQTTVKVVIQSFLSLREKSLVGRQNCSVLVE